MMHLTDVQMLVILGSMLIGVIGVLVGYLWIEAIRQYNKKLMAKAEQEFDQRDELRATRYNEAIQYSEKYWPGL